MLPAGESRAPIWQACGIFFLVALLWSSAPFLDPRSLSGESFLGHDRSYALFTADQLLAGKLLFRDVFYQYGALTAYLHAGWAKLFGNSILAYWHLAQFLTCISVIQVWALLRRSGSPWQAAALGVVVIFPYFLVPGGMAGGLLASVYVELERICLLAIAVAWKPASGRTFRVALCIGLWLGAMQWIKFGGAFVAGASLIAVDLLVLGLTRAPKQAWLRWVRICLVTLAGFLAVEGILIALAFALLPGPLAGEVLWPSWMVENYRAYHDRTVSLFHWFNLNYFLGTQLPIVAACLANTWMAVRIFLNRKDVPREQAWSLRLAGPALFLAIFFCLALLIYLPHMWVATPYVWLILLPPLLFLREMNVLMRVAFCAACFPAFLLSAKNVVYPPHVDSFQEVQLAADRLWLSREAAERIARLRSMLEILAREDASEGPARPAILGYPFGSGLHHFLGFPAATRHAWFMPGFVRPREEAELIRSLDRTFAVVVLFTEPLLGAPSPDPSSWEPFATPVFTKETCQLFANRLLPPRQVDSHCWLFPVTRPGEP